MSKSPMQDVIVLLPGITGSVLQKDGKDVWALSAGAAFSAITRLGRSIKELELDGDDPNSDDLGDGVSAPRMVPDTHLIPGLWKIDGYGKVAKTIREEFDVQLGVNFFEFPYDWRRDNRVHSRRLARESRDWLRTWRERSGNNEARLILIGHSMGGLICRHFLEVHEGWKDTRLLITFGTPYRGSLNAVDFIANGMQKKLGPLTLMNLTEVLRSFTSLYQLLPIYPCVDRGDGNLARVTEVESIPGLVAARAREALAFHREIQLAVEEHADDPEYRGNGYGIKPIAGIFQPTSQSIVVRGDAVEPLRTYQGRDEGGDGTVPSVSATPIELSNKDAEIYVRERHASLQNAGHSLDQVVGLLRRQGIDQTKRFAPGTGISLAIDDAYLTTEPVVVRALPEVEWVTLRGTVENIETRSQLVTAEMSQKSDGWHELELPHLSKGAYRVTITGAGEVEPVTDVFLVVEEGLDIDP